MGNTAIFKTRLQWINSLPEEVKHKALANFMANTPDEYQQRFLHKQEETLLDALYGSFILKDSPEGYDYWVKVIYNYAFKNKIEV